MGSLPDEPRPSHTCPRCGSRAIERHPPRSVWLRLAIRLTGRRVYQCRDCGRRFYNRPSGPPPAGGPPADAP